MIYVFLAFAIITGLQVIAPETTSRVGSIIIEAIPEPKSVREWMNRHGL